jgi:DNA-binding NarL/FixJ family response regulator
VAGTGSRTRAGPDGAGQGEQEYPGVARTVLIVDDHPQFRRSARRLLESGGFEVVGEAGDGASAIAEAERLRPDIVLLDVQLPDIDGFEVASRVAGHDGRPAIILTSAREASAYRIRLGDATARGFIAKVDLSAEAVTAMAGTGT